MNLQFLFTFVFLVAIIDLYYYRSLRIAIKGKERIKLVPNWVRYTYWGFSAFTLVFLLFAMSFYVAKVPPPPFARTYVTGFIFIVILSKITGVLFFVIDDLKNIIHWTSRSLSAAISKKENNSPKMSRGAFLKQSGLVASALPFVTMMYGVVKSAFDYNLIRVKLKAPNLPEAFHGFKMVQVSDIHSGSFISTSPLRDAVKMINEQNPDVVFFTGDLVNEVAGEAVPYIDELKQIHAKHGVFSILGNHDYGDYFYQKGDLAGRANNKAQMIDIHHKMGWDVLLNENRVLEINSQKINIMGVENWGLGGRFQKYGDVTEARKTAIDTDFKILLSHDPSHWNAVVRKEHSDIDLTLSGHTHGFQMGVEIPGYIKWSPSQYLFEEWAGLYQKDAQWIYVNRGLGFIGYPGRLGILPEITVIELEKTQA
ncbi:MAG TPA: metallophosphatase [Flavobacteriales bacterium]|nr:metallophosphatase [Flavobacteriales bacterium]